MKAVIFDLDNTLLDLIRMKKHCVAESIDAMIDAGLDMDRDQAKELLYKIYWKNIEDQQIFQKFLKKATGSVDPRMLAYAILAYRRVKTGMLAPYPGTKRTLITLRDKGLKLAVVSDAPREQAWQRLCALKLDDFFDVIITYDDSKSHKPNAKPFRMALKGLNVQAKDTLMVGDWPERDIQGAKKLGMKTALAKYGNNHEVKHIADYELEKITDLIKIFD